MALFGFGKPGVEQLTRQGSVEGLIHALGYEKDAIVREDAAYSLGEIADPRAVEESTIFSCWHSKKREEVDPSRPAHTGNPSRSSSIYGVKRDLHGGIPGENVPTTD